MPKIVKELITKWTYKVDTTQIEAAKKSIKGLQRSFTETRTSGVAFAKSEKRRIKEVQGAWHNLNGEVKKYRKTGRSMAASGGMAGAGMDTGKRRGGFFSKMRGGASGPNPLAFVGGQVLGSGLATSMFHLGAAAPQMAALAGGALGGLKAVQLAGARQQAEMVFAGMLKSEEAATRLLDSLNQFGEQTPFQITQLRNLSRNLLATGFNVKELIPVLKMMGNVTQGNNDIMRRMIINLGQIRGKGILDMREMNQFHIAGIPLGEAIAKIKGISKGEVLELVPKRGITFEDTMKALQSLQEGEGIFTGFLGKVQKSLSGAWGQFVDNLEILGEVLGGPLLFIADKTLRGMSVSIKWLTGNFKHWFIILGYILKPLGKLVMYIGSLFKMALNNRWARLFNPFTFLFDVLQDIAFMIEGKKSLIGFYLDKIINFDWSSVFTKIGDSLMKGWDKIKDLPPVQLLRKVLDFTSLGGLGYGSIAPTGAGNKYASNNIFNQNVSIGMNKGVSAADAQRAMTRSGNDLLNNLNHRLQPDVIA